MSRKWGRGGWRRAGERAAAANLPSHWRDGGAGAGVAGECSRALAVLGGKPGERQHL